METGKNIHFIGIGGSGISGVAYLAEKFGYIVTGCDKEENTAYGKNMLKGHSPSHIKDADIVVASPALFYNEEETPEVTEAKKQNKLMTWQEFLGKVLLKNKKMICIAGTHGKSTTTAMAGKLLIDAGMDPVVMVGATVPEWGRNSRYGEGEYAVVEADEFNNNFLNYYPEIAIINNIEFDHPDFFKNEDEVRESFEKFKANLVGPKILITEKDSLHKKFNLKLLGEHNQKNANMVFKLGEVLGIPEDKIIKSIESFKGIGRRLELIADGDIKIYDDYAHHPTAIGATLKALREKYPKSKIWAIDEPHGYSRTKALISEYKNIFKDADKVLIGPIYKARDKETFGMSSQKIAEVSGHPDIKGFDSFSDILKVVVNEIKKGDVILVMGAGKSYLWAREIKKTVGGVSFSELTTFRTGGKIKKYFEVGSEAELKEAAEYAASKKLPVFVIGGGTDILVSDKDFDGVVIKYTGDNIEFEDDGTVTSEAGAVWDWLCQESVERNLQGIECLSGIPGTVGAAPIQNIGAYGQEFKETFVSLKAYDLEKEKFTIFSADDCKFGYRESIFKTKEYWQKFVICNVTLKLNKNKDGKINYASLKKYITLDNPSLKEIREAVLKVRGEKLENPKEIGNAGSFFKNPVISGPEMEVLIKKFPEIKIFPFGDKYKVSAGWLLETAGWKGKTYKTAGVSKKHALVLVNPNGDATSEDVYELSEKIITDVKDKFGVTLEREVQLINFK